MRNRVRWLLGIGSILVSTFFFSCEKGGRTDVRLYADSLNHWAYEVRYKDYTLSESAAREALGIGEEYPSVKAFRNRAALDYIFRDIILCKG